MNEDRSSTPATAPMELPVWLRRQLASLLAQRGHALLLAGPSGLGQYELALALARAWLCDQPVERPGFEGACGRCASCHAVDVRSHPELLALMPDELALDWGWPVDPKTLERIEKKEIKPSKWIRVDAARGVVGFAQTTRSRGQTKVVLVYPADRLNIESANTLLKTLEEPPGDLRFVLATDAAHLLPATIRSRCQTHTLAWPSAPEAHDWLRKQVPGSNPAAVHTWLKASGGRPDDALGWAQLGLNPAQWAALPRALARGDAGPLADWPPARRLDVLQKVAHDLLVKACGAEPRYFQPADLPPAPSLRALQDWIGDLKQAARSVEHPYQAQLLLDAWMARCQSVWSPPTSGGQGARGGPPRHPVGSVSRLHSRHE